MEDSSTWQIVLYEPKNNRIVLWQPSGGRLQVQPATALFQNSTDVAEYFSELTDDACPTCHRPFSDGSFSNRSPSSSSDDLHSFVAPEYFMLLHHSTEQSHLLGVEPVTSDSTTAPLPQQVSSIPSSLLNNGYYARFFREIRQLGRGSFGVVFLVEHQLSSLSLGQFAVKKLAIGDNYSRMRSVVNHEIQTLLSIKNSHCISYKHAWLELWQPSEFCPPTTFLYLLMDYANAGTLSQWLYPPCCVQCGEESCSAAQTDIDTMPWDAPLPRCRKTQNVMRLDDASIIAVFRQMCDGLQCLHQKRIAHVSGIHYRFSSLPLRFTEGHQTRQLPLPSRCL